MDILDKINEAISLPPEKLEHDDMKELAKMLMQKLGKDSIFIANAKDMDIRGTKAFDMMKKFMTDKDWAYVKKFGSDAAFFTKQGKKIEYHFSSGNFRLH